MDKTREEFVVWIRDAMQDKKSNAFEELYQFLVACFVRADVNLDGQVNASEFDRLIEEAAELPRRYGYAPKSSNMYSSDDLRKAARSKQFSSIDGGKGYLTLDNWVTYATKHIMGKVEQLPKDYLAGSADNVSKNEFLEFIKAAMDKNSAQYRELYFFLLHNFQSGDVKKTGEIDAVAFDKLIEAAAAAPRRFGLAPRTEDLFPSDADRLAKRKEYFAKMDTNNSGTISFDEWLAYAYEHIQGKVASLK